MSTTPGWLLGLALLAGGLALSAGPTGEARRERALLDEGVETSATVERARGAYLDVAFTDERGRSRTASVPSCGDRADEQAGDGVEISYDPDDPAVARLSDCPRDSALVTTILLGVGVVALCGGTVVVLRAWRASGWRWRLVGVPLAVVGALFVATSRAPDCYCNEMIYFGGSLVVVGLGGLLGREPAPGPYG